MRIWALEVLLAILARQGLVFHEILHLECYKLFMLNTHHIDTCYINFYLVTLIFAPSWTLLNIGIGEVVELFTS